MSRMIILVQYIQQSNYNPINIADESGHTFYYYLLQSSKKQNMSDSPISINSMKQDIRHCKSLGAELNEFDRQQMNKDIQGDLDRLVTAIRDGHLTAIYDIACGLQVYDFAGLDNISAIINKDSMNEYIAECRKDPSLFKKLVEYGNLIRNYQKNSQSYNLPENHYHAAADRQLQDYNKYQTILPIYSFDKGFDLNKPLRIGVKLWSGEETAIESSKNLGEMVSHGELLDFIEKNIFENEVVKKAVQDYGWWDFSRQEKRIIDETTKKKDRFYGAEHENYSRNNKGILIRIIDFPGYEELKELLKQDIQNKIAHLQRLNDDFIALAKSIKQSGSSIDKFNAMYKDLVSFDNVYTPNELMYSALIRQYHPDKLMSKVESGELTEKQAKEIKDNIARLNGMRNAYQKEQLAKE